MLIDHRVTCILFYWIHANGWDRMMQDDAGALQNMFDPAFWEVASDPMYEQIPDDVEDEVTTNATQISPSEAIYPPPFGFHPNLTSFLNFMILMLLWSLIPFLHWASTEMFRAPLNALMVLSITGIALSNVVFVVVRLRNGQHGQPVFRDARITDVSPTGSNNLWKLGQIVQWLCCMWFPHVPYFGWGVTVFHTDFMVQYTFS